MINPMNIPAGNGAVEGRVIGVLRQRERRESEG